MDILNQVAFDIDLHLDPLWCSWFSGWIDGEGSFTSYTQRSHRGISCRLAVMLRDDDAPLIYDVKDILHCGVISRRTELMQDKRNRKDQISWTCNNTGACRQILVPLLDAFPLRSKKNNDYKIWRKLVMAISENRHLDGDRDYVLDLCQQLRDVKKYVPDVLENRL